MKVSDLLHSDHDFGDIPKRYIEIMKQAWTQIDQALREDRLDDAHDLYFIDYADLPIELRAVLWGFIDSTKRAKIKRLHEDIA